MFEETLGIFFIFAVSAKMKMKKSLWRRINWDVKTSWFIEKYIITLKNNRRKYNLRI